MTRAGAALRALAVVLYIASIAGFATGHQDAFDFALIGASLATLASAATDPRVKHMGRQRRERQDHFYQSRRDGLSAPDAWVDSESTPTVP